MSKEKWECSKWICAFNFRYFFLLSNYLVQFCCTTCIWKYFVGKKLKKKVILASQNRISEQSKAILPLMRQLNETNDTASKKKTTASHSRNAQAHNGLCNIPHLTKWVNTEISLELFTTIGHGDYSLVNATNKLIAFVVVFIHRQLNGFHPSCKTQPSTGFVNPRLWLSWIPLIPENGTLGIESITSLE